MGGYGSGRRAWGNGKAEDCLAVDIRALKKGGHLRGWWKPVAWGLYSGGGHCIASVDLRIEEEAVHFEYRVRNRDGNLEHRHRVAAIERTPCRFGGTRPWFICPRAGCGRRVTTLYIADGEVGCRHCHELLYASQSESPAGRAMRRERRIRKKLGMGPNLTVPITAKPKGMHWRTFLQLRSEAYRYNAAGLADTLRFLKKCGRRV